MRKISIFGSTGSIGTQTLDLIERDRDSFDVFAISGARNIELLAEQARRIRPKIAVTADDTAYHALKERLSGTDIDVAAGRSALLDTASEPIDWGMSGIVGFAGLEVSLQIAQSGKVLALANKESMVCGGPLLRAACKQAQTTLLPVDSEHSALFQAMLGEAREDISEITITASGGPFRSWTKDAMSGVTPAQAANHPKWSMGQRISIDSATLFNKALELIEAKELFDFHPSQIKTVIHPQSIIHALVTLRDQAVIAHLGVPDMRGVIGYALFYPKRADLPVAPLDLAALARLDFEDPDEVRFPALRLSREVMEAGGLAGAVLNGAKEAAMDAFLEGQIGFLDMAVSVEKALQDTAWDHNSACLEIDAVKQADKWSRDFVENLKKDA
ncbi:MAG: 1-deoxy-D-xylulose-5-phosphate reductoisomerase [Pseudomonadota bacterium]